MAGVNLAEGLHREEEDQLEMGDPPHKRSPVKGCGKSLTRRAAHQRGMIHLTGYARHLL